MYHMIEQLNKQTKAKKKTPVAKKSWRAHLTDQANEKTNTKTEKRWCSQFRNLSFFFSITKSVDSIYLQAKSNEKKNYRLESTLKCSFTFDLMFVLRSNRNRWTDKQTVVAIPSDWFSHFRMTFAFLHTQKQKHCTTNGGESSVWKRPQREKAHRTNYWMCVYGNYYLW